MRVHHEIRTLHANHQPNSIAVICGARGPKGVRVSEFVQRAKDPKHTDHKRLCVGCIAALPPCPIPTMAKGVLPATPIETLGTLSVSGWAPRAGLGSGCLARGVGGLLIRDPLNKDSSTDERYRKHNIPNLERWLGKFDIAIRSDSTTSATLAPPTSSAGPGARPGVSPRCVTTLATVHRRSLNAMPTSGKVIL